MNVLSPEKDAKEARGMTKNEATGVRWTRCGRTADGAEVRARP